MKLGDFGLMKRIHEIQGARYKKGTMPYMAPEILLMKPEQQLSAGELSNDPLPADMWALGMTTFELLTGHTIFTDDEQGEMDILNASQSQKLALAIKELEIKEFSEECRTFVSQLLTVSPGDRLTAEGALNSLWISEYMSLSQNTTWPEEYFLEFWD